MKPSSVGELAPNLEAQLDVQHEYSKQYEFPVGEFLVRGPNIMKGYWKNENATRETKLPGGWIRTGDVGYFDAEGKITIVDRLKVNLQDGIRKTTLKTGIDIANNAILKLGADKS